MSLLEDNVTLSTPFLKNLQMIRFAVNEFEYQYENFLAIYSDEYRTTNFKKS